jgi:hypothetical protein
MNVKSMSVLVMLALAAFAAATTSVRAQTYQGTLRGSVRDSQGVLPGVDVLLINQETKASRSAVTNDQGEYIFASVLPERARANGFAVASRKSYAQGRLSLCTYRRSKLLG